jgi:hypothetical protein
MPSRPPALQALGEPDVFEMFTNGGNIAVRPEVCPVGSAAGCTPGLPYFAVTKTKPGRRSRGQVFDSRSFVLI